MARLQGKTVLITGAALGLGRATALRMAEEGASVAITDVLEREGAAFADELTDRGFTACFWRLDVSREADVAQVIDAAAARFGRLDILVNNAGVAGANKPTDQVTEAEWDFVQAINVKGVFFCTKHAIPHLRKAGGGSIINLSSIEGFRGYPLNVVYGTFKHAVTGFTRGLALELALDRIRVNLIAPETTDTEQVPIGQFIKPENRARADLTLPLNRFGRPEDSAGAAVFLASDLSGWVTGQSLIVDGGGLVGNIWQRVPPDNRWTNLPFITGACNG